MDGENAVGAGQVEVPQPASLPPKPADPPKPPEPPKPPVPATADEKAGNPPPPNGEGPGSGHMRFAGIAGMAVYLIGVTALLVYLLVLLWPRPTPTGDPQQVPVRPGGTTSSEKPTVYLAAPGSVPVSKPTDSEIKDRPKQLCGDHDPACTLCVTQEMQLQFESQRRNDPQCTVIFGKHLLLWQEVRLLLLVLLGGGIGALLHAFLSLVAHVGNRNFVASWTAFYYLTPASGALVAFVAYVVVRGGFFASNATTADTNPFTFVALAALGGLFQEQFMVKLKTLAETAFDKLQQSKDPIRVGKPVIDTVNPSRVPAGSKDPVTIEGSGFVDGSVVRFDGAVVQASRLSDKKMTFVLPAGTTLGPHKVVVATPAPESVTSGETTIEVIAGG